MNMRLGLLGVTLVTLGAFSCDSSSGSSACGPFEACGGNVVGTWSIKEVCGQKEQPAELDGCPEATVDIKEVKFQGTLSLKADMTYTSSVSVGGHARLNIPGKCLTMQGVTITCAQLDMVLRQQNPMASCSGSSSCTCRVPFPAEMDMGSGTWQTRDSRLVLTETGGEPDEVAYCVQGNTLRIKEPSMGMPMDAAFESMVLVKQ